MYVFSLNGTTSLYSATILAPGDYIASVGIVAICSLLQDIVHVQDLCKCARVCVCVCVCVWLIRAGSDYLGAINATRACT